MNRALEAVERVRLVAAGDLKRLVVLVPADLALRHRKPPPLPSVTALPEAQVSKRPHRQIWSRDRGSVELNSHEFWALVHGILLGGAFLLAFTGGLAGLYSPKSMLLADPDTTDWHEFAMEWKEHIAWIAPMLATAAAFIVVYYRSDLIRNQFARKLAMGLLIGAFVCA